MHKWVMHNGESIPVHPWVAEYIVQGVLHNTEAYTNMWHLGALPNNEHCNTE